MNLWQYFFSVGALRAAFLVAFGSPPGRTPDPQAQPQMSIREGIQRKVSVVHRPIAKELRERRYQGHCGDGRIVEEECSRHRRRWKSLKSTTPAEPGRAQWDPLDCARTLRQPPAAFLPSFWLFDRRQERHLLRLRHERRDRRARCSHLYL